MHPDRICLFNAINLFINDCLCNRYAGEEKFEEAFEAFRDIVVSTAVVLDRTAGLPDDSAAFDALFERSFEGCDPNSYARAHGLRDLIFKHARMTLAAAARRGEDPACCDPGGGMRSSHEIDEEEPF